MIGDPMLTPKGYRITLERIKTPSWYGAEIESVFVDVEFQERERIRIKIYDATRERYEVPSLIPSPPGQAQNPLYDIVFGQLPSFHFRILRRSTGTVLFDSSLGGLKISDQFLQIAARLPSTNVYGFGETKHTTFRHDMNWKSWSMFARDQPVDSLNLYSVHPFFTALDNDGNMFGGLFLNSNAQEVTLTPAPGLVYKTIGGVLDMYFFLGPEPESVIQQYTTAIGRPIMPSYWSLGFHLSKYGYGNLANMSAAVSRMRMYDIPLDVQHGDIDYFDRNMDFTYDKFNYSGLPEYVRQLKAEGTRFITILDPFIETGEPAGAYPPYERGQQLDIWIKKADGTTNVLSKIWPPTLSVYPDYGLPSAQLWWTEQCVAFHDVIEFDGLWVDMNEPASFVHGSPDGCANNLWNYPLYLPRTLGYQGEPLFAKTICTDYQATSQGRRYDVHSLYGRTSSIATLQALRESTGGKRGIVISRSSFPGSGAVSGRWLGDNNVSWESMQESIIGTLEHNLFGVPYVGADICGYFGDSNPKLCTRWMQVGAFYPFSRNHNGLYADHDPGVWPDVAVVSREVLHIRYRLLPYLYTLFHEAHARGNTVFRPLLHEFPREPATYGISRQFLWGPAFLVTPVLDLDQTTVTGYFPDAPWYRFRDGILESYRKESGLLSAPENFIPLHVRGGYILPTQAPANSTVFSRNSPMGLIVALDDTGSAVGSLFWDEGDTVDTYENNEYFLGRYTAMSRSLTSSVDHDGYAPTGLLHFDVIDVWGVTSAPTQVLVNGNSWSSFEYISVARTLKIHSLTLVVNQPFTVSW